ncbi:MAG: PqqD family peptide modification chaperone [Armatimonadota bacterium]
MYRPIAPDTLREYRQNGFILLIDPDRPAWAMVNSIGAEIAHLCNGNRSDAEIADILAVKYDKPYDEILEHVQKFLSMLEKARLVHEGEIPPVERMDMANYEGRIASVAFELTERCNLRCVHCFEGAGKSAKLEPSTDEVMSWIDKFLDIPNVMIDLTGGEFLMRSDWRELMQHLVDRKASGIILTNGTLIDNDIANDMAEFSKKGNFLFQISLDGPTPEINDQIRGKGSFHEITRGIRTLINHGLSEKIVISFTPNRINIKSLPSMIDLAMEFGVPKIHFSLLNKMGRASVIWDQIRPEPADLAAFFEEANEYGEKYSDRISISGDFCSMLHEKISRIPAQPMIGCRIGVDIKIDTEGNVYPCTPIAFDPKYSLGNIKDMTAEEIRQSSKLHELRMMFIPRMESISRCSACSWKCFCFGGCIARAELNYGTTIHEDDLCPVADELYKKSFFEIAERVKRQSHAKA